MILPPRIPTRTHTLFPYSTLFRSIARTVSGAAREVPLICRNLTFQRVTIQPSVQHQLAAVPRIAQPAGCSQPVGKMIVDLAINSLGNTAGVTRGIAKNLGIRIKYAERLRIGLLISLFNEIIESAYPFQPSRRSGELQFFAELFLPGVRDE